MDLQSIQKMAQGDLESNPDDIEFISIQTPILQSKYLRLLNEESLRLTRLESKKDQLFMEKWKLYKYNYDYVIDKKDDLLAHINGDSDMVEIKERIALSKRTMDYLEDIIKTLRERSFHIRNLIEYRKFISGT